MKEMKEDIYKELRDKIKEKKDEAGFSYAALEARTGISKSTIQRYITGKTARLPIDFLFKLEEVFNMKKGTLSGWGREEDKPLSAINSVFEKKIPIYQTYAEYAGFNNKRRNKPKNALSFKENTEKYSSAAYPKVISYAEKPIYSQGREYWFSSDTYEYDMDFCVEMNDNSMEGARILKGDIVFVKKCDNINNGEIAAVSIFGSVTLKIFYKSSDGIMLCSANNNSYPTVITDPKEKDFHILGKAVCFQSRLQNL